MCNWNKWSIRALVLCSMIGALACAGNAQKASELHLLVSPEDGDADVYVDGNYIGQVKELNLPSIGRPRLAPGTHRIELRKAGRFPSQQTVRVDRKPAPVVEVRAELLEDPIHN